MAIQTASVIAAPKSTLGKLGYMNSETAPNRAKPLDQR
jgi:hypothetical protein